ncbi:MAG: type II toxin-antitoxin system Phd/YefM family antitoxin [Hyphomicrobium sp.]|jgi:prevent-host-death family protein
MRTVTDIYAKQDFDALIDDARSGPILVRREGKDAAIILSVEDYRRLTATHADVPT